MATSPDPLDELAKMVANGSVTITNIRIAELEAEVERLKKPIS